MNPTYWALLWAALLAAVLVFGMNVLVFGNPLTSSLEIRTARWGMFIIDHDTKTVKACSRNGCWPVEDQEQE